MDWIGLGSATASALAIPSATASASVRPQASFLALALALAIVFSSLALSYEMHTCRLWPESSAASDSKIELAPDFDVRLEAVEALDRSDSDSDSDSGSASASAGQHTFGGHSNARR